MFTYLPNYIISRSGELKDLEVFVRNNKLVLNCIGSRKSIIFDRYIELNEENFIAIGLYFAEGNKLVSIRSNSTFHSGGTAFCNSNFTL